MTGEEKGERAGEKAEGAERVVGKAERAEREEEGEREGEREVLGEREGGGGEGAFQVSKIVLHETGRSESPQPYFALNSVA